MRGLEVTSARRRIVSLEILWGKKGKLISKHPRTSVIQIQQHTTDEKTQVITSRHVISPPFLKSLENQHLPLLHRLLYSL